MRSLQFSFWREKVALVHVLQRDWVTLGKWQRSHDVGIGISMLKQLIVLHYLMFSISASDWRLGHKHWPLQICSTLKNCCCFCILRDEGSLPSGKVELTKGVWAPNTRWINKALTVKRYADATFLYSFSSWCWNHGQGLLMCKITPNNTCAGRQEIALWVFKSITHQVCKRTHANTLSLCPVPLSLCLLHNLILSVGILMQKLILHCIAITTGS